MTGAYAAASVADPFDRAASFLTCLIDSLSRPDTLLLPHEQVEQDAENGARELARLLLQGHLDLRARQEEAHLSALDTGGRAALAAGRTRLEKHHRRQLATVVGTVTITRCALRAPKQPNYYPADAVLGLPGGRHSLGLRRLAVLEAVRGSYDQAVEAVERHCGTRPLGKRQAEQLVRRQDPLRGRPRAEGIRRCLARHQSLRQEVEHHPQVGQERPAQPRRLPLGLRRNHRLTRSQSPLPATPR